MRKLLLALATLAGVVSASYFAFATPAPVLGPSSGCMEANQLLNCLNSAVINLLRGTGPTGLAQTAPLSVGSYGTVSGATPVTLNTQGGQASFTGVAITLDTTVSVVVNDSLVTASSACVANVGNSAGTAYVGSVLTGAGTITFGLGAPATLASQTVAVNFWCFN